MGKGGVSSDHRRMLGSGLAVPIATPPAVLESAIWPTCVSGASPANHGMFATVKIKVGTYDMEEAMYADRLPHLPFWAHLSRGGEARCRDRRPLRPADETIEWHSGHQLGGP